MRGYSSGVFGVVCGSDATVVTGLFRVAMMLLLLLLAVLVVLSDVAGATFGDDSSPGVLSPKRRWR